MLSINQITGFFLFSTSPELIDELFWILIFLHADRHVPKDGMEALCL